MRERIRDQLVVLPSSFTYTYYKPDGSYCMSELGVSKWVNGNYSRMIDAGTKKTDRIRTRYLEHHRSEIQSYPIKSRNDSYYLSKCGGTATYQITGVVSPGYTVRDNPWILSGSEINQKILDAFRFFEAGCVDQKTLLANFAWELPDVRNLWPAFRDLFIARPGKVGKFRPKREIKSVANAYLAYNFGVVPLIGDLVRCYERLKSLDDHITWLRKNSGQKTRVEFRSGLSSPTSSTLPSRPSTPPTGNGSWRKVTELRAGFKAWAIVTYDVSTLTDLQLKTRTLMRSFGLNNPAAVIWEAIPYSFVVDWISNIGELIGDLEIPITLPCVFHDCGHGFWVESVFEDYYKDSGKNHLLRRTRTRGYSRRQGLPISISGLSLETPTAKQLSLGLALLAQKF